MIDFSKSKGYLLDKNALSIEEVDEISNNIFNLDLKNVDNGDIFKDGLLIKQIQHLEKNPNIGRFGGRLMDRYGINGKIINMQLFVKHPNYKMTKPHQDGAYFNSENYVTFWIPLQDVDIGNSCLFYLENSHLFGLLEHDETGIVTRNRSGVVGRSMEYRNIDPNRYTPIVMKKGDILYHHPFTLHYSCVNTSDNIRYALTCIVNRVC